MEAKTHQNFHKIVHIAVVFAVSDAFRFDNQQALEGVDNFLNFFPMVRILLNFFDIALDNFINFFVFFDKDQE